MNLLTPFNIVIFSLWFLSALSDFSEYCYIWQLKEYRLDRMKDFFSTIQGRQFWTRYSIFGRSCIALVVFFWPFNEVLSLKSAILIIFTVDLLYNLYCFIRRRIRHPKPTHKALLIVALSLAVVFGISILSRDWNIVLILMAGSFFVLSGMVFFVNFLFSCVKRWYIARATQKILKHPHLLVIGITGSYGKSSVKEYTSRILQEKFRVIKTPGNTNTDIGVAQFILATDFKDADVFVVEMGAYCAGEIEKICDIVKPRIGILTTIIEQHLSLFGSIKKIQETKYELLRSLPVTGFAITCSDNPYCLEMLFDIQCANRRTFGEDLVNMPNYCISDIRASLDSVAWNVDIDGKTINFSSPLLGAHQPINVTPAIMAARYCGMSWAEIQSGVNRLKPGEKSISMSNYGSAIIIDDSHNSNPIGFKAALNILNMVPSHKRRIIITRGMLELGEKTREYHERIGEEIAFSADELVIITPDFVDDFMVGIDALKSKYRLDVKTIFSPDDLLEYVKQCTHNDCVILLENRIPEKVLSELKSKI